ncbi:MAG: serpin family protein [Candidatus Bipolaricaulota bacterium]
MRRRQALRYGMMVGLGLLMVAGAAWGSGCANEGDLIVGAGTVRHIPLAGGFYGIVAEDGTEYLPLNLDVRFQVDHLRVVFAVKPEPDAVTIHMWGTPVRVVEVHRQGDDGAELVAGITAFALALYDHLRAGPGNLIFSPLSISAALAMTYAGARGETAAEMAELRFTLPDARLHYAFQALLAAIRRIGKHHELALANGLWGQQDFGFLAEFLELARTRYGAELREVDFERETESARQEINAWVARETRGRIAELLAPSDLDKFARLVLGNAIYFRADWAVQFKPELTRDADFRLPSGETVTVPMMTQTDRFPYAAVEDIQILELPYEGHEAAMVVILPRPGLCLGELEARLTPQNLAFWLGELRQVKVGVHLPRFVVRAKLALHEVLPAMGIELAFSDECDPETGVLRADLSGLAGTRDLYVQKVVHEAFIEVDERGTEAAAATAVVVGPPLMTWPPEFIADRPFLFLVRHRTTDSILFLGRVTDPRLR